MRPGSEHRGTVSPESRSTIDWTESPYVAAFFAFDCLSSLHFDEGQAAVRIFTFDLEAWRKANRQWATSLRDPWPDFQFLHPPAHNNPRYYPQQSMAAFSNVDDIEGFVAAYEMRNSETYLTRIDIFASERESSRIKSNIKLTDQMALSDLKEIKTFCKTLMKW